MDMYYSYQEYLLLFIQEIHIVCEGSYVKS